MTDSMSSTWSTVEDAATALGCSARTVRRRVAAGRLESRPGPDGRTLVRLPDDATASSAMLAAVQEQVETSRQLAGVMAGTHASLAEVHRDTLTRLQAAEASVRKRTAVAWSGVSIAAASVTAAVLVAVTMTDRVRTADGHVVREVEQRQAAETRLGDLQADLADARQAVTASAGDLELSRTRVGHLSDRLTAADAERDRLEEELDRARKELAAWRADLLLGHLVPSDPGSPEAIAKVDSDL